MKITPLPQQLVVSCSDYFPTIHVIISITETNDFLPRFKDNPNRLGILRLHFHDVDSPRPGSIHFTRSMARQVADFVNKHKRSLLEEVIIHCTAGLSRSPGLAAALARGMFGQDDQRYFDQYYPNRLVYRTMLRVLEDRSDYEPSDEGEWDQPAHLDGPS